MSVYHIHPLMPQGGTSVPDRQLVAAIVHRNENGGALQVLIPTFKTKLEALFESPVIDEGGRLEPWRWKGWFCHAFRC